MRRGLPRAFAWRLTLRERLYAQPYYRLVYGESDGLPGLVIDRFGEQCVVQIGTAGMERLKPHIQEAVLEVLSPRRCCSRMTAATRDARGIAGYVEVAKGRLRREADWSSRMA